MGAERDAHGGVRLPSGPIPGHAHHGRQRPVPLDHVYPRGRARRGDRRRAVDLRPAGLRRRPEGCLADRLQAPRRRVVERGGRRAHLPEQPRPAVRDRCRYRRAGPALRHRRERPADRGPRPPGEPPRVRSDLAASGVRGPGDRGEPRARPGATEVRFPRNRAGVRRTHGTAPLGVLHHPAIERRLRRGRLGEGVVALHRPRQRVGVHVAGRRARAAVRADEHAEQRLLGRPPGRSEPVRRVAGVPRRAHRRAPLALPDGTPRCGTTTSPRRRTW